MKELRIIVCAKEIPDPEAPLSDVSVDAEKMAVNVDAPQVISPFDENALEAALRITEEMDAKITVLSMGKKVSDTVLRKSLAAGADELILLQDDVFEKLDSHSVAHVLSDAIKKIGEYDLVLTGRQAGDWDAGQVGLILGEMLGIPCINLAREIRVEDGNVLVKKNIPGGYEQVRARIPALVTVSNEVGGVAVYLEDQDDENDKIKDLYPLMEQCRFCYGTGNAEKYGNPRTLIATGYEQELPVSRWQYTRRKSR